MSNESVAAVLGALYLPGLRRPFEVPRARWRQVDSVIRKHGAEGLADAELRQEGLIACTPALVLAADAVLASGAAMTAACEAYPRAWLERLGEATPPALWLCGSL